MTLNAYFIKHRLPSVPVNKADKTEHTFILLYIETGLKSVSVLFIASHSRREDLNSDPHLSGPSVYALSANFRTLCGGFRYIL